MAKVNCDSPRAKVLFRDIKIGHYFIYCYKLYLKVDTFSAWDFKEDTFATVGENALVLFKDTTDIEITVE